jgi:long-chain acyl-CoA synthetase
MPSSGSRNSRLQDHQRIRGASVWTAAHSPHRGTRKLKRAAIRDWVRSGETPVAAASSDSLESLLERFAHGRDVSGTTTLEELGLSSLERVELMIALEDRFQTRLDEGRFSQAASVADLRQLVEQPAAPDEVAEPVDFPSWNRTWPVRIIRRLSQATWILPLARAFAWARIEGREHLRDLDGPVLFAANHQSHMDVPVILAALPGAHPSARGAGDGKGILQSALFSRGVHVEAVVHQLRELLSRRVLLQRVSAAAARGRRAADAHLRRRADWRGLVHPDLPGG